MSPFLLPRAAGVLLMAAVLLLPSCSKSRSAGGTPEENMQNFELHEIGSLLDVYIAEKGKAPAKLSDLKPYEVGFPNGFAALESGKCVAVWGVDPTKSANKSQTVLAYQKETPTQGGLVLLADHAIRKLSADQFKSMSKG